MPTEVADLDKLELAWLDLGQPLLDAAERQHVDRGWRDRGRRRVECHEGAAVASFDAARARGDSATRRMRM